MNTLNFVKRAWAILALCAATAIALSAQSFKPLYVFDGKDGSSPEGIVTFDTVGNLYGTTLGGGFYSSNCFSVGCGTVYELTPNPSGPWGHKVLHAFTGDEDNGPSQGVTFDTAGNLYGMTDIGPDSGDVYELVPQSGGTWSEIVLYRMAGAFDGNPWGGLIFDASGNLYGTSGWGCGYGDGVSCVFEMTPEGGSWTFNLLYGLDGSAGWLPSRTTPIFDAKGNLYATTAFGGNSGCSPYGNGCYGLGVVFELSPNGTGTWALNDLYKFTGGKEDGLSPACPLVFDAAGNLYGTTAYGGAYGYGTVFKLTPNADGTWTETVLHLFSGGKDGSISQAGLIFDAAGNLYGTTSAGGAYGYGVVFKLTPTSNGPWHETVLHAFLNKADGAYPLGGLVPDNAGNLYGTTSGDGTTTFGSVFEITP